MMALILATLAMHTSPQIEIGPYRTDCPNGIAFIENGRQVALLRIGWIENGKYLSGYGDLSDPARELRYGLSAADGSYQELSWKAGEGTVKLRWGESAGGRMEGLFQTDRDLSLVLELTGEANGCSAIVKDGVAGVLGYDTEPRAFGLVVEAESGGDRPVGAKASWVAPDRQALIPLLTALGRAANPAKGGAAAIAFDLKAGQALAFGGTYGDLDRVPPEFDLDEARLRALRRVPAATGPWGDFLAPISACMHFSKTFSPDNKMIAHTVSRGWCMPDGQVLFCWDSFFNGLLASLDDPVGAKGTVRAALAGMTKAGFVPNFSGRPWGTSEDRSQPPVGAMCVWKMHQRHPDPAFLKEVYPKLVKWHDWWFKKRPDTGLPMRDGNQNGLLEWGSETGDLQNAKFESGLDDSPMFDDGSMAGPNMRMESVDLNSLWAMDAEYLARIAGALGKEKDAARFTKERDDMAKRMDEVLWDEEVGMYCNRLWEPVPKTDTVDLRGLLAADGKPGLKGEYYRGRAFEELKASRLDEAVDFDWEGKSPAEGLGKDDFSVRWTGTFTPKKAGPYVFGLTADDGVRMWLDDKPVIDDWTIHAPQRTASKPIELEAGKAYDVKIEFFQATGGARIKLDLSRIDENAPPKVFNTRLSPCNFYPMIAGIPNKERGERMLKMLLDPAKFWGEFVCPTIMRDDPAFPQQHYWRGKIWAPSNYLIWLGLKRYAPQNVLDGFAKKSVALFMRNWNKDGTCHENFLSTGEGSSDPHYTWGALLCLIGLENVLDVDPDGKVIANPRLGVGVRNVPIGGKLRSVKGAARD